MQPTRDSLDADPPSRRRAPAAGGALLLAALLAASGLQWRLGGAAAGGLGVAAALLAAGALIWAMRRSERRSDALEAERDARREADATLRRSEAQLRALVENLQDGVVSLDEQGAIQAANPAAARLFGYDPGALVGRSFAELAPGRASIAGGGEAECRRKDGAGFFADVSVVEVEVGGRRAYVGRIHDLTERKSAEEALRHAHRMEAVGQLTGGVAHDFNNILTVVMAYSGLLCEALEGGDGKLLKMAEAIRAAARNAADLTRQLLAFARRQSLEPSEVDVSELLKAMQRLLRPALGDRIELELRLADEPARVFLDRSQLEAALMNLVVNGREAMPEGGRLTIETSLAAGVDGGRQVALAVRDEGVGMTEEVRRRAFEPFFTTKEVGRGSGLGLSMVYGFVKQSGGDVRLESEPGRGACVTLLLPASSAERAGSPAPPAGGAPGGDETILVVEDAPLVRDFVVSELRRLGYRVIEAADGPAALAEIERAGRLDLVFADIAMPGRMTGFALADAARRQRPQLPFLFTSGYSDGEVAQPPPAAAGFDLLRKPYELSELAARIRAALAQGRS